MVASHNPIYQSHQSDALVYNDTDSIVTVTGISLEKNDLDHFKKVSRTCFKKAIKLLPSLEKTEKSHLYNLRSHIIEKLDPPRKCKNR